MQYTLMMNGTPVTIVKNESMLAVNKGDGFEIMEVIPGLLYTLESDPNTIVRPTYYYVNDPDRQPLIANNECYVKFKSSLSESGKAAILATHQMEHLTGNYYTCTYDNAIETAVELQGNNNVFLAEPDLGTMVAFHSPSPTDQITADLFADQWTFENDGTKNQFTDLDALFTEGADAKIIEAWQQLGNLGDPNQTIMVCDDSFQIQHADFSPISRIVARKNIETDTEDVSPQGQERHGTPVFGIVAANTGGRVVGVLPNSKVVLAKFPSIIEARYIRKLVDLAIQYNVAVWTNSWGPSNPRWVRPTAIDDELRRAATEGRNGKGTVIVFSGGNDLRLLPTGSLAASPHVISVSAIGARNEVPVYSNIGCDIAGYSIFGAQPGVVTSDNIQPGGYNNAADYTADFGGTSAAAPLVAGVCGLILTANPNLTAIEVKQILRASATNIENYPPDASGYNTWVGHGAVNAFEAVRLAQNYNTSVTSATIIGSAGVPRTFKYGTSMDLGEYQTKSILLGAGKWSIIFYDKSKNAELYLAKDRRPNKLEGYEKVRSLSNTVASVLELEPDKTTRYYFTVNAKAGDINRYTILATLTQ